MIRVYDILTKQIVYLNPSQVVYVSYLDKDDNGYEKFEVYLSNNDYLHVYRACFMAIKKELKQCQQ